MAESSAQAPGNLALAARSQSSRRNPGPVRRTLRNPWFQRAWTWGLLLVGWQLFSNHVGTFFFPSLGGVLEGYVTVFTDGSLRLVASSFEQMFVGFGLAALIGIPLGLLIGSFRTVDWLLRPYVNILFVTSLAAVLPFLILVFGTGFQFRVAVVFLFAIFYIIITPADGVKSIDSKINEMASSFSVSHTRRFFSITMPGTIPFIISGLRLGLGQAVQGMIIAELWVTIGTGRKLITLGLDRELGEFFALASIIVIIGTVLAQLLLYMQNRISPWSADAMHSVKGAG